MKRVITVLLIFLVCVSLTSKPVKAEGLFSDFFDVVKKWFEASPFGNLFSMPVNRVETVKMVFYPETFEMDVEDFVNISTNTTIISNFKGDVNVDMPNKILTLKESGTSLMIRENIGEIKFNELKINNLELKEVKLLITSGNWNESTENGTLTINNFLGDCLIREGEIHLEGNVSTLTKK